MLVVEDLEHAQARGARIYAEVIGYATRSEAFHIAAPLPDGIGAAATMQAAMASAGIGPDEIDYVNAHATSTPLGDVNETQGIKLALGARAYRVPVSATKSMTGHLIGASGALEALIVTKTLETGIVTPTINLDNPDPECDLDYVPHEARRADIRTAISNSFGFGGANASLVLRRWDG
jgi:3-oxoacyl-[acyl-carrier-protein] synthase II